jgi:hypothetical protein
MMAWLKITLCKTLFFILGFVGISSLTYAGPLEDFSELAKSVNTMSTCPDYNSTDAHSSLAQAAACVQLSNGNSIAKQGLELSKIKEKVESNTEDRYFAILAAQHSNELVCASEFASQVAAGNPVSDKILTNQFRDLRRYKLALRTAIQKVASDPKVNIKACPFFQNELNHDFPDVKAREQNKSYQACSEVIRERTAYNTTLSTIPLFQQPAVSAALEKYLLSNAELSDSDLENLIRATYKKATTELGEQAQDIRKKAQSGDSSVFSRSDKHALLADPRLTEKVLTDGGQSEALKAVACTADARYGSGADDLDKGLFVGSLLIGGGMAVKAVGMTAKLTTAANTGRAIGAYSLTTSNLIKMAVVGGVQGTATWSEIEKNCFENSVKSEVTGACSDAPSIKKMEQDNCYLVGTLAAIQVAPTAVVAKLVADQNRLAKLQKTAELEAESQKYQTKLQVRRDALATKKEGVPLNEHSPMAVDDLKIARRKKEIAQKRAQNVKNAHKKSWKEACMTSTILK